MIQGNFRGNRAVTQLLLFFFANYDREDQEEYLPMRDYWVMEKHNRSF